MYKANARLTMDRYVALYRRQMQDQILVVFDTSGEPTPIAASSPDEAPPNPDEVWTDRPCRSVVDMEGIVLEGKEWAQATAHLPDDSLPVLYPTAHFGESLASGLLGGKIRFVGTAKYTCSGAEPLIVEWADFHKLRYGEDLPWTQPYVAALRKAAELDQDGMFFHHFVTMDALNLAVELRGTTQAYTDIYEHPQHLRELMEFGVEYMAWFFQLEQKIMGPHNDAVAGGHPFAREAPSIGLPWSSVDAYVPCAPRVYRDMGLEYHDRFFEKVSGGTMHTHGTRLMELLPMIAEIRHLTSLQPGKDLWSGEELPFFELLPQIRRITKDLPLVYCQISGQEFMDGLKEHRLVGGAQYIVSWPGLDDDQMARWMEQVYAYRWHE